MDSNLLNNVKNSIAKRFNTTSLQLEVIHVITWKDLKIDPTRSEVFIKDKNSISLGLFATSALNNSKPKCVLQECLRLISMTMCIDVTDANRS
jgi:hypothetical protein